MLSLNTLTEISNYFIGDTGDIYSYKKGRELVYFFNKHFGYQDYYSSGFDSRWYYTRNKLVELQDNGKLDDFFNIIMEHNFVKNDLWSLKSNQVDEHIKKILEVFNDICKKDKCRILIKNNKYVVSDYIDKCNFNIFEYQPTKIINDIYDEDESIWSIVIAEKDDENYIAITKTHESIEEPSIEYIVLPEKVIHCLYDMLDNGIEYLLKQGVKTTRTKWSFDKKLNCVYCDVKEDEIILERDNTACYDSIKLPMFIAQHIADELRILDGSKEIRYPNKKTIIPSKTVFIKCNTIYCNKHHNIVDITGSIQAIRNEKETTIKVPIIYCKECQEYYILERNLNKIPNNITLLCRIIDINDRRNNHNIKSNNYSDYAKESVLKQCGYSVNKNDNLSNYTRKRILVNIINNKILKRAEILTHLGWLIDNNAYNLKFKDAVIKWQEDYDFVSNLRSDSLPKIEIETIIRSFKKCYSKTPDRIVNMEERILKALESQRTKSADNPNCKP